jgi:hypothetical protein
MSALCNLATDLQPKEPRATLKQVLAFITAADCEQLRATEWWLNETRKHQPKNKESNEQTKIQTTGASAAAGHHLLG